MWADCMLACKSAHVDAWTERHLMSKSSCEAAGSAEGAILRMARLNWKADHACMKRLAELETRPVMSKKYGVSHTICELRVGLRKQRAAKQSVGIKY